MLIIPLLYFAKSVLQDRPHGSLVCGQGRGPQKGYFCAVKTSSGSNFLAIGGDNAAVDFGAELGEQNRVGDQGQTG
jgi:hypothetical protein